MNNAELDHPKEFQRRIPLAPIRDRYQGCLLGGAVGDALGAPVEFLSRAEILRKFGPRGLTDMAPAYGKLGAITDDTQMTLFTAEGSLRAYVRGTLRWICHPPSVLHYSYLRWLHTGYKGDDPRMLLLYKQIEDRVNALPGVQASSFSAFTFGEGSWNTKIVVPGMPFDTKANVMHNIIGNGYFKVMQIPLLAGRTFGPQDTATSQPVAIVSENMARNLFPFGPVIGRTYSIGDPNTAGHDALKGRTVIGIAKDVKGEDLVGSGDYIDYLPYTQREWGFGDFEVRYSGDFGAISREVQDAIHSVDRRLPIMNVETLIQQVANSYSDQTIIAELSGFFALTAVFLSCIGLYGLMSYLVGRRTGEIGIRMALGAARSQVGWRVVREIAVLVLAGIAIGLPVTLAGSRLAGNMLYGVGGTDPMSLAAAVLLLALAGLVAGYLPARRASRINPVVALRDE